MNAELERINTALKQLQVAKTVKDTIQEYACFYSVTAIESILEAVIQHYKGSFVKDLTLNELIKEAEGFIKLNERIKDLIEKRIVQYEELDITDGLQDEMQITQDEADATFEAAVQIVADIILETEVKKTYSQASVKEHFDVVKIAREQSSDSNR